MSKKKIVIFEFQDLRYASRARKEAFSLSNNGINVTLIGFNRNIIKKRKYIFKGVWFVEIPVLNLFQNRFIGKVLNIFYFNLFLLWFLLRENFDVYHLHDLKLFFPAYLTYLIKRKPLIYDAHELHIRKREKQTVRNKILNRYDEFKERILIKVSTFILQASDLRAVFFADYYKTEKPIVIENHDNLQLINYNLPNIRDILKLKKNDIILIYTGNISIGGNQSIDNVIKSLIYLPENVYFCIMGRGNQNSIGELENIARELKVQNRFKVIPPVVSENVVSTIQSADIGVIPIYANCLNSEYSALNKLSQSLMAGLAIIGSYYSNLKDVVLNNDIGKVGSLFAPQDPESIAKATLEVINGDMEYLKQNARRLAEIKLNWEYEEKKLVNIYNKIFNEYNNN